MGTRTVRTTTARRRWALVTAAAVAAMVAVALAPLLAAEPAGAAVTPSLIEGSGSSWAENAVNEWVADVASQGVQVVYTPDGDAQGRQDFANRTSDFSVTSDGYQGFDPVTGINDTSQGRLYAYLPIAAGGTSFPYQIRIDGNQVQFGSAHAAPPAGQFVGHGSQSGLFGSVSQGDVARGGSYVLLMKR